MNEWSSFKNDQLIMESWRGFLNERERTRTGTIGQQVDRFVVSASELAFEFKEVMEELNLDLETYIPVVEKVLSTELAPRDSSVEVKDRCAKSKIDFIMCMFEASCEVLNLDDLSRKKQLNQLETTLQNPAVDLEKIARELLDKINKQIEDGINSAKDCEKKRIGQKKQIAQRTNVRQPLVPRDPSRLRATAPAPVRENNEKE